MPKVNDVELDNNLPYHPALPSMTMAHENYETVISDHVPILSTIPWEENNSPLNEIKIVSWNVLENDFHNAYAPSNKNSYDETPEQAKARLIRIAESLKKLVEKNSPHFITLQEITYTEDPNSLIQRIKTQLGENWAIVYAENEDGERNDVITLYNTAYFTHSVEYNKRIDIEKNTFLKGTQAKFLLNNNNNDYSVNIFNIHAKYNDLPIIHEEQIKEFLDADKNINNKSIVIGDFNCHIAPLDNSRCNISTSLSGASFNSPKIQGSSAVDGAAYSVKINEQTMFKQAVSQHLNPLTGEEFIRPELAPLDITVLPKDQQDEVNRYRMVMCFDESYTTKKLIAGKTIFDYENNLKVRFKDQSIRVRHSANLNNEKAIALMMTHKKLIPKNEIEIKKKLLFKIENFDFENKFQLKTFDNLMDSFKQDTILYAADRDVPLLNAIINNFDTLEFIDQKFNFYSEHSRNFGFFSKAAFGSEDINNMKENLIEFIAQGKIAKAFYILQKEMDYVSQVKSKDFANVKNSLMYQKLQEIKDKMTADYPVVANIYNTIHEQFDSYFNPSLLFKYKIFFDLRTYDKESVDNIELDLMNILDERITAGNNNNLQAQAIIQELNKIIEANNVDVQDNNDGISKYKFKENSAMKKRLDNIIKNLQKNYPDNDSSDNINKIQ